MKAEVRYSLACLNVVAVLFQVRARRLVEVNGRFCS